MFLQHRFSDSSLTIWRTLLQKENNSRDGPEATLTNFLQTDSSCSLCWGPSVRPSANMTQEARLPVYTSIPHPTSVSFFWHKDNSVKRNRSASHRRPRVFVSYFGENSWIKIPARDVFTAPILRRFINNLENMFSNGKRRRRSRPEATLTDFRQSDLSCGL